VFSPLFVRTQIYLRNNRLNEVDQSTFYNMASLDTLDLSHNNISTLHPETFRFLTNLTTLTLSNNSLHMDSFYTLFR
jgi:Leucine-rich repeat (LRR) protein